MKRIKFDFYINWIPWDNGGKSLYEKKWTTLNFSKEQFKNYLIDLKHYMDIEYGRYYKDTDKVSSVSWIKLEIVDDPTGDSINFNFDTKAGAIEYSMAHFTIDEIISKIDFISNLVDSFKDSKE